MTKNPFDSIGKTQAKNWDLDEFCEESNRLNFVRSSGRLYFISKMNMPDGTVRRYLDRNA